MNHPTRLVLGISGGIAAYKVPGLIRLLQKRGIEVKVVMTEASRSLVAEKALRTVSNNIVYYDNASYEYDLEHIDLAEWAETVLICPATANTMAKIAHGIADNLLTTIVLAFDGPLILVPAMNTKMWINPATQQNKKILTDRGVNVLPVGIGELACGTSGPGRMIDVDSIVEYTLGAFLPRCFTNKKIVIVSGPTVEPVDKVRVLTNKSSGKMGASLAYTALNMGANVTVITGPAQVPPPPEADIVNVQTTDEMFNAVVNVFDGADIIIMVAAVADFKVKNPVSGKINRETVDSPNIELVSNVDIAKYLGEHKKNQFIVCFSLETGSDAYERAQKKLVSKKCNMMVLNKADVSLGTNESEVTIFNNNGGSCKVSLADKKNIAEEILLEVSNQMGLNND